MDRFANLLDEFEPPLSPPRSALYSLPLLGRCGATQESLVDYAKRLSVRHNVRFKDLLVRVILPEAGLDGLVGGSISLDSKKPEAGLARLVRYTLDSKNLLSLNGTSAGADAFLAGMLRLTGQTALISGTFLRWRGLFSGGLSMAATTRWCVQCLEEHDHSGPLACSLLWCVSSVAACPIHRSKLQTRCPRRGCGKLQARVNEAALFARCQHCRGDLRLAQSNTPLTARQMFDAEAVAEMIGAQDVRDIATTSNYQKRFDDLAEQFGCSQYALTTRLKLSRMTVRNSGTSIERLLETAYRLGVTPVSYLRGAQAEPRDVTQMTTFMTRPRKTAAERDCLDQEFAQMVTEKVREAAVPINARETARQLGVPVQFLYHSFPEQMRRIQDHNASARGAASASKQAAAMETARDVAREMSKPGQKGTIKALNERLHARGVHWTMTEAYIEARRILGLPRVTP